MFFKVLWQFYFKNINIYQMPGITSLTSFKTDVKTLAVNLKMCKMGHIMSKSWWGAGEAHA